MSRLGVALTGWGRFVNAAGDKITVPAPTTDLGKPWLWDFLTSQAHALRQVGFTAIQLPPCGKAQGGAYEGCDGYGLFDPRDIGSKPQQGGVPTRYGTADSLRRLVAVANANGLDVYLDLVLHQRIGANAGAGSYRYLGADGVGLHGRGALDPGCFRQVPPANRPQDAVPNTFYDFSFGDELVYQNCDPPRRTIDDALDYGDWVFRTTGAAGARFDDAKGVWAPFAREFMTSRAMAGKFFYAEYFAGSDEINGWTNAAPMNGRSLAEDFPLHFSLQNACNAYDARILEGAGYAARRPDQAITFVDNPDTDTSPGQQVASNKLLAYAFLLSIEGYPFVFGKDYFGPDVWPGAYGLKPWIDNLVWIHEHLAGGPTTTRYVDDKVIVLERLGKPGLLTCLNFDTWNSRTLRTATAFGAGVRLHDYSGHHHDVWTDGEGSATFTIPSNVDSGGRSYLCFGRAGLDNANVVTRRTTTQTFFGADDLDLPAVRNGSLPAGRVFCNGGTSLSVSIAVVETGWTASSLLTIEIVKQDGATLAWHTHKIGSSAHLRETIPVSGWYRIVLKGANLPSTGSAFQIDVTYTASQQVED